MTEQNLTHQEPDPLEERVGNLAAELELAIHWQRPFISLIAYTSEYVRADCVSMLENALMDLDQRTAWVHADACANDVIDAWNESFEDPQATVFFIDGFSSGLIMRSSFRSTLSYYRNLFAEKKVRVVLWLTTRDVSLLARSAPEFWIARDRLVELTEAPKPEQMLRSALESAWQGTGEYSDRFEDTEAKISLRESFLTELPANAESTGTRANLLLTLGILHWRKGDYEKAAEMLRNALQIATRLHDNWFEAECFNAIALVNSSLGRNDEAIDAYKQAIRLAPDQIFAWNNLGNLCLKIQRNDEAMIAFQKTIEHNAEDPIAWNGLGDVYSRIEYIDDAIAAYRKSIEYGPMFPHPWNGLGEMYARTGRPNEAVLAFQNALKLNQHFISSWLGLARLHVKQERYRDAVKAYQQAIANDPKNSLLWNELGSTYFSSSRYHDAVESFLKAIELDRTFAWAYSNLGLAHATYGRVHDSIELYRKSLDLFTNDADKAVAWNRLANSYRMLNEYDNAIKAYGEADALNSRNDRISEADVSNEPRLESVSEALSAPKAESSQPVDGGGTSLEETPSPGPDPAPEDEAPYWIFHPSTPTESAATSAKASRSPEPVDTITHEIGGISLQMSLPLFSPVTKNSCNVEIPSQDSAQACVWNEKGNVHFRAAAYEDAIQSYEKAINLDAFFGWPYCNLGLTYLIQNRYAEAILLLQKSIELLQTDRDRAVAWHGLASLYRRLNDYDNALVAYQKADELDPENAGVRIETELFQSGPNANTAQVWNELGDLFFKSGSYEEAANCYSKAIEMEPLRGLSYSNLAQCFSFQSRFKEAIPLYVKSIELFHADADKAVAWNRLGNAYRKLNDYDNAVTAYQNAVKLNHEQTNLVTRARFSLLGNCYVD